MSSYFFSFVLSHVSGHSVELVSRIREEVITAPIEVAKRKVVSTPKEGTQGMDIDLPMMEEAKENDGGNNNILEIQEDRLSLPNMDKIEKEEEEKEEKEKGRRRRRKRRRRSKKRGTLRQSSN